MIVRQRAYARVGFVGNPSDGYHGKTIAFTIGDFHADATLYESPEIELRPCPQDDAVFEDVADLCDSVRRTGYYGGIRLLKAAIKVFADYCAEAGIAIPRRNFTMVYETTVPRQVGLGGSSAIITAAMKALMQFYDVCVPIEVLPNIVLKAETEELGLVAGLQDRVIQAYGGLVYMDFDKDYMDAHGHGRYERLDPALLPPVYVAYRTDLSKESSAAHSHVRELYEMGDPHVRGTMSEIAALADEGRALLEARDYASLAAVINRNFDLRRSIFTLREADVRMVMTARSTGASCSFCGSGGAVVGTFVDPAMLERLRNGMTEAGYRFVVPQVAPNHVV